MNLPRSLGARLRTAGHSARHVGDIGLGRASDPEIIREAREHQEVILTNDLDYGHLLAFEVASAPSVVIFRLANSSPDRLYNRLSQALPAITTAIADGAIVVLEEGTIRIRDLPIESRPT